MPDRFVTLWERRVPHATVLYLGAGWGVISFFDWLAERSLLQPRWVDVGLIMLVGLLPSVLVVAWIHGPKGRQRTAGFERVGVAVNVVAVAALASAVTSGPRVEVVQVQAAELTSGRLTFLEAAGFAGLEYSPDGGELAILAVDSLGYHLLRLDLGGDAPADTLAHFDLASRLSWRENEGLSVVAFVDSLASFGLHRVEDDGSLSLLCDLALCSVSPDATRRVGSYQNRPDALRLSVASPERGDSTVRAVTLKPQTRSLTGIIWSPVGSLVAVSRSGWIEAPGALESARLDVVDVDSGRQWEIWTADPGSGVRLLRWSTDGRTLDFFVGLELYRATLTSPTDGQVITVGSFGFPPRGPNGFVAVSPDGLDAVYPQNVAYRATLVATDVTSPDAQGHSDAQPAPVGLWNKWALSVSPDGSSVAFFDGEAGRGLSVWERETGDVKRVDLEGIPTPNISGTRWSPDGSRLAVRLNGTPSRLVSLDLGRVTAPKLISVELGGNSFTWCGEDELLYQVPGNRDYMVRNVERAGEELLFGGREQGWMFNPACAPDGRTIAFGYNHRDGRGLWLVDRESLDDRLLVPDSVQLIRPLAWSDDAQTVYFHHPGLRPFGVYEVSATGGQARLALRLRASTGSMAMSRDASTLASIEYDTARDLWLSRRFAEPGEPR